LLQTLAAEGEDYSGSVSTAVFRMIEAAKKNSEIALTAGVESFAGALHQATRV
jgi:hypothetical protein